MQYDLVTTNPQSRRRFGVEFRRARASQEVSQARRIALSCTQAGRHVAIAAAQTRVKKKASAESIAASPSFFCVLARCATPASP
jgi:hypothetical protein